VNIATAPLRVLADRRTYCVNVLAELADATDAGSVRRSIQIRATLDQIDAALRTRCTDCGLPLSLPTSLARQKGDTCYHKNGA
jgi:hypothetical protein